MILFRRAGTAAGALVALGLGGCMHVPVSTVYKLATFDVASADPAVIRAAVRYPSALAVKPGGVALTITTSRRGEKDKHADIFVLEEAKDSADLDAIARYRRSGTTVAAYRLADRDVVRARQILSDHQAASKRGERPGHKSIGVAATACHVAGLPPGAILTSTFLKLDMAGGYMTVLEDLDLRSQLSAEALAAEVKPCSAG